MYSSIVEGYPFPLRWPRGTPTMRTELTQLHATLDDCRFTYHGVEAWAARDLMRPLGYDKWQNFRHALERAIESCTAQGRDPSRHFIPFVGKLILSPDKAFTGVGKSLKGD